MRPQRLTPLPAPEWDERARASLGSLLPAERANPAGAGNVLSTMVRHPDLLAAYLPFNAYVLRNSTLTPRIREVALLRAVHLCDCEYLWNHHIPLAEREGITAAEIEAIRTGTGLGPDDQLVIDAVDDMAGSHTFSQATWDRLTQVFTDQQVMDLVFTIGSYSLLAGAVNTFGIQNEHS